MGHEEDGEAGQRRRHGNTEHECYMRKVLLVFPLAIFECGGGGQTTVTKQRFILASSRASTPLTRLARCGIAVEMQSLLIVAGLVLAAAQGVEQVRKESWSAPQIF